MNGIHLAASPQSGVPLRSSLLASVLVCLGTATVAAALLADGSIAAVVAPVAAVALLWMMWVMPLRMPLFAVTFLGLALDKPGDSSGLWQSPLAPLGGLLIQNLNKTINVEALKISLLVLLVVYLLAIRLHRVWSGSLVDGPGSIKPSSALLAGIGLSLLTACGLAGMGIATGGDVQMVKLQILNFLTLLAFAYLVAVSFRGLRDYRILATLVVAAACVKSGMAVWFRMTLPRLPDGNELEYATTHGDSLLFACAVVLLVSLYYEKPIRRNLFRAVLLLPILLAGLLANDRRLAWVQIGASLLIMIALNPRSRSARAIIRTMVYSLPVVALYGTVGWHSDARVFAPVQMIRSMGDGTVDRSTMFRDIENYNLLATAHRQPLLGLGFGHPFDEVVANDALPGFKEYFFLPHNSILGLWAFAGPFGFSALWSVFLVGLFLAARSYRVAALPEHRVAVTMAMTSIVVFVVHCWGDIGFTEYKSIFITGSGLAIAGQMAVATGAWPGVSRNHQAEERA